CRRRRQSCGDVYEACSACIRPSLRESAKACRQRLCRRRRIMRARALRARVMARLFAARRLQICEGLAYEGFSAKWVPREEFASSELHFLLVAQVLPAEKQLLHGDRDRKGRYPGLDKTPAGPRPFCRDSLRLARASRIRRSNAATQEREAQCAS